MSDTMIEVSNLGKCYRIDHQGQKGYSSLRDEITKVAKGVFSKTSASNTVEDFWAVKDVNFEIKQGEAVGIIGRNGAGKSTLLKLLSRITEPTKGRITLNGRIASLLEVGTGFHPELSGRENIFLNGAILGMSRREIKQKFDEIVDFSGVEKFLDTPVKRYSSGMYVRLAFAVAAHLEPEILVVDEVLAVGDAEFQRKCLGKMNDVSNKDGRTVLFVSHNLDAIQTLCPRSLLMQAGTTTGIVSTQEAVHKYLYGEDFDSKGHEVFRPDKEHMQACILEGRLIDSKGQTTNYHETCEDIFVEVTWENIAGVNVNPAIELHTFSGIEVFSVLDTPADWDGSLKREKGIYRSVAKINKNFLKAGEYFLRLGLYCYKPQDLLDLRSGVLNFTLIDPMDERCLARGVYKFPFTNNVILPALEWNTAKIG